MVYDSLDALSRDHTVCAVIISVPTDSVIDVVEQVAPIGGPFLAEKPVAATSADLTRIRRLSRAGANLIAPFNRRYQDHVRLTRDAIPRGRIGEVVRVRCAWRGPYRSRYGPQGATFRRRMGYRAGVLFDTGTHALDCVLFLLGDEEPVQVEAAWVARNERGADVEADLHFRVGAIPVSLSIRDNGDDHWGEEWRVHVVGTRGQLWLDDRALISESTDGAKAVDPAGEMVRPATDLVNHWSGMRILGSSLTTVVRLSEIVCAAYTLANARPAAWIRPRAKALGRLNGAC